LYTPGPSTGTLKNQIDYSNYENSFNNTSSDDSDYNNSNSTDTLWKDDYIPIPDFHFDTTTSGIKLNIEKTARHSPIEIFNQIWTKEVIDIIVKSTNAYGLNQKK